MTWTQGPPAPRPRAYSVCTIADDALIVSGGTMDFGVEAPLILLFDLTKNKFVDEYKPTWSDTSTTTSSTSSATSTVGIRGHTAIPIASKTLDPNAGSDDDLHNQAVIIGGGAAGAVSVLIAIGAGFFLYHRKRSHSRKPIFQPQGWSAIGDHDGEGTLSLYGSRNLTVAIPSGTLPDEIETPFAAWDVYSAVYSTYRKSLLYSGRSVDEDGTKIVVFGGELETANTTDFLPTSELWFLDVPTMTWTQGPSALQPRSKGSCTIVNNMLINWGGLVGKNTVAYPVILFDLKTNTFVNEYRPTWSNTSTATTGINPAASSATGSRSGTSAPNASETPDPNSSNKDSFHIEAAVVGVGAAGAAMLLIAIGAGLIFYRRKQAQRRKPIFQGWSSTGDSRDFSLGFKYTGLDSEAIPMRAEFLEQERQKWRGSAASQPFMSRGGNSDEWMQMVKAAMSIDPANAFKAGVAVALEASALSPRERELQLQILEVSFRERQRGIQTDIQNVQDSALFPQSLNPSDLAWNSFGIVAPSDVPPTPSSFQQPSQCQGQQWSSPVSPLALPQRDQQEELYRQSVQLLHLQQQQLHQQLQLLQKLQVHPDQQGPVSSPPPLNYSTQP
ncbi:hypothetical protein EMPS_00315 [Entomortierella parvispora]|uniref:Uncharacterized protein n=1 Tax=Entomortierella parvispora TaxID=205924 RepID=A0A9P3H0E8_9FUNG|nr:hypothetical protein EMPS_00315 [Entomortierella parvispora]